MPRASFYIQIGGIPPRQGETPLGHEPADSSDAGKGDRVPSGHLLFIVTCS